MKLGDLVQFIWPKDDNKTWEKRFGIIVDREKIVHGNAQVSLLRDDGIWMVPKNWCVKVND